MNRQIPSLLTIFILVAVLVWPAAAQTTVFEETFDGVVEPDLPSTVLSSADSWSTSSSSESGGSGLNNLRHGGTTPGDIVFGPVDLQHASSVTITYLARRTSSYPADSLTLAVSTDDGASWTTLMGPGSALPDVTSDYEPVSTPIPDSIAAGNVIRLRFRGYGGTSSGSNIRIDDLIITADVDLSGVSDSFGFGAASSTASSQEVNLALDLAWTGTDSIQGIQFDVDFDASLLSMTGISAGSPVSGPGWTADFSTSGGSARVILLGGAEDIIPTGVYPAILSLDFAPVAGAAPSGTTTTVSIRDLIVSAHNAGGSDLAVIAAPHEHTVTLEYAEPSIALSADSLSLGSVDVGSSGAGIVTVSNPTGQGDLLVSGVLSSSPVFSAAPGSFSVPPGGAVDLEISYAPSATDFGFASAVLTLTHNAPSGSSQVSASATGTGGRGDVTNDGIVDVGDVVSGIDAVLERTDPVVAAGTIDLYPFPAGDGAVDVRDLTVLVHAILNDSWPDDVALPAENSHVPQMGKRSGAKIVLSGNRPDGTVLGVEVGEALRGIQIELRGLDAEPEVRMPRPSSPVEADGVGDSAGRATFTRSVFDPDIGRFVLISASSDAVLDGAGRLELLGLPASFELEDIVSATGVTSDLERLKLSVSDRRGTSTETPETTGLELSVFPNPARSGHPATVRIRRAERGADVAAVAWSIRIVDLLGREVLSRDVASTQSDFELDTSSLPAGLYLIRAGDREIFKTVPLTVIR